MLFFRITGSLHLPNGNVFALETDTGEEVMCINKLIKEVVQQINA